MKKIVLSLCLVLLLCPCSNGAVSEDIYVRQDVFDAKMEAFMAEIRLMNEQLLGKVHAELTELKGDVKALNSKMDILGGRMSGLERRMSSLEVMIYWVLGTLAIVFAVAAVVLAALTLRPQLKEAPMPSFTLDDVKRLIAEAKLGGVPQV